MERDNFRLSKKILSDFSKYKIFDWMFFISARIERQNKNFEHLQSWVNKNNKKQQNVILLFCPYVRWLLTDFQYFLLAHFADNLQ